MLEPFPNIPLRFLSYSLGSPVWGAAQGVWPPFLRCGLRWSQGMHAAGSLRQGNSPPPSTNHDHDEDGPHASEGMSPSTRRSPLYLNDADQHFIALTRCWHRPSYFFSWEYLLLLYNSMHTFYWDVFPYHLFSQLTAIKWVIFEKRLHDADNVPLVFVSMHTLYRYMFSNNVLSWLTANG